MICPVCNARARVIDTGHKMIGEVWRKHKCLCGNVFFSKEKIFNGNLSKIRQTLVKRGDK